MATKAEHLYKPHTAVALYVTDRASEQIRLQPKPVLTDFGMQPHVDLVCRLMVTTPAIHVCTWIITHTPTQEGQKAELANP